MYGVQLWSKFAPKELDRLRVAYNNVFRTLMLVDRRDSVSAAFITKKINHFNVLYRKTVYGFRSRFLDSSNILVKKIACSPAFVYGKLYSKWNDMLYIIRNN